MNFKRWLYRWLTDYDREASCEPKARMTRIGNSINQINFSVMAASGGVVVNVTTRNTKNGNHNEHEHIHVLHDDEDVASNIGQLVAMELIKAS